MIKFSEILNKYLNEYVVYPEHKQVNNFIAFLKDKGIKEVNEVNFDNLVSEFTNKGNDFDRDFINKFWDSFIQDLRENGISDRFNYNKS